QHRRHWPRLPTLFLRCSLRRFLNRAGFPRHRPWLDRTPSAGVPAMNLVPLVSVVPQAPAAQLGDRLLEVVERLEAPVHRGEPEVGDLVKVAERPKDGEPHLVRWHLGEAARPDRLLNPP